MAVAGVEPAWRAYETLCVTGSKPLCPARDSNPHLPGLNRILSQGLSLGLLPIELAGRLAVVLILAPTAGQQVSLYHDTTMRAASPEGFEPSYFRLKGGWLAVSLYGPKSSLRAFRVTVSTHDFAFRYFCLDALIGVIPLCSCKAYCPTDENRTRLNGLTIRPPRQQRPMSGISCRIRTHTA